MTVELSSGLEAESCIFGKGEVRSMSTGKWGVDVRGWDLESQVLRTV